MKKLINILRFTCKKATELMEKSNFQPLSFSEKLKLKFHKKICKVCSEYSSQSILFDKVLKDISSSTDKVPFKENRELKEKILRKLF